VAGETPATGPLAALTQRLQQGRELVAGVADVAALEGRLAVQSLAQMLALAVGSALLACSAWGLLLAAIAFALARAGVPWLWLLPAMAVVNGLLTWWAVRRLSALTEDLGFTATRQLLRTLPKMLTERYEHDEESPPAAP
jgi:hypothetical protein